MTSGTLLPRLRSAIGPLHDEAERSGPLAPLARPDGRMTAEDYRAALERLHGFVAPAEARLAAAAPWQALGLDYEARRRLPLLESDLAFLGTNLDAIRHLAPCGLPDFASAMAALGCMYVLEGSRLGGRVLAACAAERFGFRGRGTDYFSGNGQDPDPLWAEFGEFLEAQAPTADRQREVLDGAVDAFARLNAWLAGPAHVRG